MALSSALFTGISGLASFGSAMQVIGDNISNVNTIGYKQNRVHFEDLLSHSMGTMSGSAQVGLGAGIGDVSSLFEQGAFESSSRASDLAIDGNGFFEVKRNDEVFYTRAGNFDRDKDGYLVNPQGYILQGWEVDENEENQGDVTDIRITDSTLPPSETDLLKCIVNLNSDADDKTGGGDDALAVAWNGSKDKPIDESMYEYQASLKIFDSLGSDHDLTVYFDRAETESAWEFIVTCNPSEDMRTNLGSTDEARGLLSRGLIKFDPDEGTITDIDFYNFTGKDSGGDGVDRSASSNWTKQDESSDLTDGYFTFSPEFSQGSPMTVKLDLGSKYDGSGWSNDYLTTTQYAGSSRAFYNYANGYAAGDLNSFSVETDGLIKATYSNGQIRSLFRVALASFKNPQGLEKRGGNLFKQTDESGNVTRNNPGENGTGIIMANTLEQSNVDLAEEFVNMISTQRGFQAASKVITITDQMLAELVNLKR